MSSSKVVFAGPVGPKDAEELALADGERHPVHGADRLVGLHQAVDLDRRDSRSWPMSRWSLRLPGAGRTRVR
jgi:hypothetical protein